MHLILTFILVFIVIKKGNWKEWNKYILTIHYVVISNLLYNVLCHDYYLWQYRPDSFFPKSHVIIDLTYTFINLPAITLLFLTFYPFSAARSERFIYFSKWVVGSFIVGFPFYWFGRLDLHHGYEYWMDFLFYTLMYCMIRLHFTRPIATYGISLLAIVFLMMVFKVPVE
ncbi:MULTISPECIES: hypothetical protein [unclassified Bacillus (in: firmicutes)]|uniref:hypothetical protein n=1 Tax=unclassified Bacillus (in: firmicutes) TaxID=185979 RepID=UPI0008E7A5E2|nr:MULTISPECIES: hypothetical protein [unclassified Bacillus (in: firmicutes)]SFA87154.1 hypothetical protein SAMN02799634_102203 [Bacillus sp. UNCCL13]SFQ84101.1 hypothetical protein SAMN04488577_2323 [Bacillus sp. cl95]